MLRKCKGSKQDILKGLLVIRNTPLSCGKSPAELLLGRKLRDNLPEISCQDVSGEAQVRKVAEERQNQKEYHDRKIASSRTLKNVISFTPNDLVAVQHPETKTWSVRGKIISRTDERSYNIKTKEGTLLRRNIITHLAGQTYVWHGCKWNFAGPQIYLQPAKIKSQHFGVLLKFLVCN